MRIEHRELWWRGASLAAVASLVTSAVAWTVLSRVFHAEKPAEIVARAFRIQGMTGILLSLFAVIIFGTIDRVAGVRSGRIFAWGPVIGAVSILAFPATALLFYYSISKVL